MNKKILAGTMALALMAGQFSTMAFADNKDKATVIKPATVKVELIKTITSGTVPLMTNLKGQILTEKELEELTKNWKGVVLKKGQIDGTIVEPINGQIELIQLMPSVEAVPAAKLVPATKK